MKNKILCVCTDREGRTMEKWVSIDSRTVTFGKTEFILKSQDALTALNATGWYYFFPRWVLVFKFIAPKESFKRNPAQKLNYDKLTFDVSQLNRK